MTHRIFQDENGTSWEAWDVRPSIVQLTLRQTGVASASNNPGFALPPDLRDGWLAFHSADESRRLAPIPVTWSMLSDAELCQLAETARRIRR